MKKLILVGAAGLALSGAGPAFAADLPPEMPLKASFVQRFTWTSCYLGAHLGGGWAKENSRRKKARTNTPKRHRYLP